MLIYKFSFNKRIVAILGFICLSCNILVFAQKTKEDINTDWYHLSFDIDSVFGIGTTQTYQYIAKKKYKPQREIIVAVIDGGVDIDHEDLKANIWLNKQERLNGKDDDRNGYVDDLHGWNFLGKTGDTLVLEKVGTEAFREYKRLRPVYEDMEKQQITLLTGKEKEEYDYFLNVRKKAGIGSYLYYSSYLQAIAESFRAIDSLLVHTHGNKEFVLSDLASLHPTDSIYSQYLEVVTNSTFMYDSLTPWKKTYDYHIANFELAKNRVQSLDDISSPRDSLVGDDITNIDDRFYGNPIINTYAYHGTVVSGIIGAVRGNGLGIDGIAGHVKIMPIRAIPDGDEYDKDVALAIRYAVDNGANIINMSFGKDFSPHEEWVKDAIQYASERNVLLVQASGNTGRDIDSLVSYPTGYMKDGKKPGGYIKVGATKADGELYSLSNYGKREVDLFAPGVNIYALDADNGYDFVDGGTSLAAPMVSGAAALIWSYFPGLTASQLKDIIVSTVTKRENERVELPGQKQKGKNVLFSDLSASGGILNTYNAFLKADIIYNKKTNIFRRNK